MSHTITHQSSPTEIKIQSSVHQSRYQVFVLPEKLEGALTEKLKWIPEAGTIHCGKHLKCTACTFSMPRAQFVPDSPKEAYHTKDKPSRAWLVLSVLCTSCFSLFLRKRMTELKFASINGNAFFSIFIIFVFCLLELRVWPHFYNLSYFSQQLYIPWATTSQAMWRKESTHIALEKKDTRLLN